MQINANSDVIIVYIWKNAYFSPLKEFSTLGLGVEVEIKMTMQKEYQLKIHPI